MKRKDFLKLAGMSLILSACKKEEMPNPNINRKVLVGGVSTVYNANAETYFSRAGISDIRERNAVATLFNTLQATAALWDSVKNGALYLISPTSYGASLYNSVNTNFDLTAGVAPTYSTLGHSYNGTTQYLKTGLIPSTTCSRNSFLMGWTDTLATSNRGCPIGCHQAPTARCILQPWYNGVNFYGIYLESAFDLTGTNASPNGRYLFTVNNTTNRLWLKNEATLIQDAVNTFAGSLPNNEMYIGGYNNAGTPALTPCTITTAFIGTTALNSTNAPLFSAAIKKYNDTVISGGR